MRIKTFLSFLIAATLITGGAYARLHPNSVNMGNGYEWHRPDLRRAGTGAGAVSVFDLPEWRRPVMAPWATYVWQTLAASKYTWQPEIVRPFHPVVACQYEAKQVQKPIINGVSDKVTVVLLGLLFGGVMALMAWVLLATRIGLV